MKRERALDVFEHLKDIQDPELFERERKRLIAEFLAGIKDPAKRRMLEATQFAVDREREKYKDPFVCADRIYRLMLERGLFRLNDVFSGRLGKKAPLIPFKKK